MECIANCCISKRKTSKEEKKKAVRMTAWIDQQPPSLNNCTELPPVIKCANNNCSQCTSDLSSWRSASIRNTLYKFCSEECWKDWLSPNSHQCIPTLAPFRMSYGSPLSIANSPNSVAILSKNEIPLIHI